MSKKIRTIKLPMQITGLSDGLSVPCSVCYELPKFDYIVDDAFWNKLVPKRWRTGVICLGCLDKIAWHEGLNVGKHLLFVQFTGLETTVILRPEKIFIAGDDKHWTDC